jgi:3-mercaptopyruvate sulfurtransferase SseA
VTRKPSGFEVDGAKNIDATTAKSLHDRGIPFVDIGGDYRKGHIPGAYNLQWYFAEPGFNEIVLLQVADKSKTLVIYSPMLISEHYIYPAYASAMAVSWGFEKVYYFADGLPGWKAAGFPVEIGN